MPLPFTSDPRQPQHLRISGIQCNPTVGDISGNLTKILQFCHEVYQQGSHIAIFGELAIDGYPMEDLTLRSTVIERSLSAVQELARRLRDENLGSLVVIVGHLDRDQAGPRNAASILHNGAVLGIYWKHWLPNYGVFDEKRWFIPGGRLPIIECGTTRLGLVICEDIWQAGGPVTSYAELGIDGLICINASPYHEYQPAIRRDIIARRSREIAAPLFYVNIIGGQDELIFDGDSQFIHAEGNDVQVLAHAGKFQESTIFYDLPQISLPHKRPTVVTHTAADGIVWRIDNIQISLAASTPLNIPENTSGNDAQILSLGKSHSENHSDTQLISWLSSGPWEKAILEEIWQALVLGTRDYVHKSGGKTVLLGLSGGIDSALVAAIACDAFGSDNVHAVAMPSVYSSRDSLEDAEVLAQMTGLHYRIEPIEKMVAVYKDQLDLTGLAEENIQARCRGMLLMALSNKEGHLVLATGNKSELSVGYSTMYGDAVGAYSPIRDVYKTLVYMLAQWRNAYNTSQGLAPIIPQNTIIKPPTAELRPNQKDSDSLPEYDVLDAILTRYIEKDMDPPAIEQELHLNLEEVIRICTLVDRSEYKRRQYPLGPKITTKAFGKDRRVPIINKWSREW